MKIRDVSMSLRNVAVLAFLLLSVVSWNPAVVSSQTEDGVAQNDAPLDDPVIAKPEDNPTRDPLTAHVVDQQASIQLDDDPTQAQELLSDLDPKGNCSVEIKQFCTKTSESLLECISKELYNGKEGNAISASCEQEWRAVKILLYKNLTLSQNLADACKADIKKTCRGRFLPGGTLACLRNAMGSLSQLCQEQVFLAEKDAVYDFRMDPLLSQSCSEDAAKFCKDVVPGEGRIQTCLRNHPGSISYSCKSELFRQERENAGDLRLHVELYNACLNDKERFCPDLKYGDSQLEGCLEKNRLDPSFSASCMVEFDKLLARRSSDFRLNPVLREKCDQDIKKLCGALRQDIGKVSNDEPIIIHCLQTHIGSLENTVCKNEVHKLLALAAEDYRFDKEFAEACEVSKRKYCMESKNDKVLSCLQSKRESLDIRCRGAVFTMEWRLSGDIDYKIAMKSACTTEIAKFCPGLERDHDHGHTIECLQQNVDDLSIGEDCKREIIADQLESAKDYRLNYRIYNDCRRDLDSICPAPKFCKGSRPCGGVVLECLQDNLDKLSSDDCKKDIMKFELKEAKNIDLNVPLQTACADALTKFCPRRMVDHSRALACLRLHRTELTEDCKREELRFSMMEASDIRLTPFLMNACGSELENMCKNVPSTNGEAFKCLQLNLESVNMGAHCKIEVDLQGARQASDYRLDVRVRTECKEDVGRFCSTIDKNEDGHAPVLKCFVSHYKNLSRGCQTEVAYATRMALWQYKFGSDLTLPCDNVVEKFCNVTDAKPIDGVVIGTYGQCLTTMRRRDVDSGCRALVRVATTEGFYIGRNNSNADMAAAQAKFDELMHGADFNKSGNGLILVTTVVALVAILAVTLFRRYSGPPRTYTLVVKHGDV